MLPMAIVSIIVWLPTTAMAQRIADRQQNTGPSSATAPSIITTDGERKAIVFVYLDGNLVQQYKYYLWRDDCYLTYEPNNFAPVPPAACQ
jgi:hypothetical protein